MKRLVLSILLVLAGVAAGALVFQSQPVPVADPIGTALEPRVIRPTVGSITSIVVLDGAVRPVDTVSLRADVSGTVAEILVAAGDAVVAGQTLLRLKSAAGEVLEVTAPADGVVASVAALPGEQVEVGHDLLVFAPAAYLAEAVVPPELLYRLYDPPLAMQAQVERGPAPFDCPFVSIGAVIDGGNPLESPVHISCRIPVSTRVFAGIRTRLIVTTGKVENVLTVPVEALSGNADSGLVWVVDSDGRSEARSVKLGLTDGIRIQILAGLDLDERILDIPPSTDASSAQ